MTNGETEMQTIVRNKVIKILLCYKLALAWKERKRELG